MKKCLEMILLKHGTAKFPKWQSGGQCEARYANAQIFELGEKKHIQFVGYP